MNHFAARLGRRDVVLFAPGALMLAALPLDIVQQPALSSGVLGLGVLMAMFLYFAFAWGRVNELANADRNLKASRR